MTAFKSILTTMTVGVVLGSLRPVEAALSFSNGGSGMNYSVTDSGLSQVIPDNNPSGVGYSINFANTGLSVNNISVTLNLSGGYNGDIYAYLSHGSQISTLLNNNPAVSGSGFNITLVEGTGNPIPTGGSGILTGSSYTAYTDLATFNSTDPNGNWTLFFADLNPGDTSTLNSFSIALTAVPEPITIALPIFGGLMITTWIVRRFIARPPQNLA
jgi:subtilisin-like proprotein convertase family protein